MQTGRIPTKPGDIIVTHSAGAGASYHVWRVDTFGQQDVGPSGYAFTAAGLIEALQRIDIMVDAHPGSIFLRELDTFNWTRLSD